MGKAPCTWPANGGRPRPSPSLQMGASPDKRARDGHTALSYAVSFGHLAIIDHLLAAGADVDRPGPNVSAFDYGRPARQG